MAWYEQTGPDAAAVRKSVKQHYIKNGNIGSLVLTSRLESRQNYLEFPQCYKIMADHYLDGILENRINGKEGDYGSWRGFATFGLSPEIQQRIEGDIQLALVEIKNRLGAQKVVNTEVEEFGLRPPDQTSEGEGSKGMLTNLGGGMYREMEAKFNNQ